MCSTENKEEEVCFSGILVCDMIQFLKRIEKTNSSHSLSLTDRETLRI